jgi:hypothetical protein
MCCRISHSGFATRSVVGLYILLATFLIGYFTVAAIPWLLKLRFVELGPSATPVSQPCVEEDRLSLYLPHPPEYQSEGQLPYIQIVNDGVESVFIFVGEDVYDKGDLIQRPLIGGEVADHGYRQVEIKPAEAEFFQVSTSYLSELDGHSLLVTFNYSKSDLTHGRVVTALFRDARHSIPDRCYYK